MKNMINYFYKILTNFKENSSFFIILLLISIPTILLFYNTKTSMTIYPFIVACVIALFFLNLGKISEITAKLPGDAEFKAKTRELQQTVNEAEIIKEYLREITIFAAEGIVKQSFVMRTDAGGYMKPKLQKLIELKELLKNMEKKPKEINNKVFTQKNLNQLFFDYIEMDLIDTISKEINNFNPEHLRNQIRQETTNNTIIENVNKNYLEREIKREGNLSNLPSNINQKLEELEYFKTELVDKI